MIIITVVNRPDAGIDGQEADFSFSASELIRAFSENEVEADRLYGGKVLEVHGKVKEVISHETAPILVIGDTGRDINISCYLQRENVQQFSQIRPGDDVKVKGICNGMLTDIMLDRALLLTR